MAKKLENEFENEVDEFLQPNIDINKSIERQKTCFEKPKGPKKDDNFKMIPRSMVGDSKTYNDGIQIIEENREKRRLEKEKIRKK